jgi:hypothetical protein
MQSWDIRVGRGAGPLALGMKPSEVGAALGPPDHESEDGDERLWSYPGLALTFVDDRLDYFHLEKPEASLAGVNVIGLDRAGLLSLGLGAPHAFSTARVLRAAEAESGILWKSALYFWLTDGKVTRVQIQDAR